MPVSEREKREAVTFIGATDVPPLDDINQAFDDWRSSFEGGEEPGKLRAYEIPIDERGNVMATAKNQIRLGSWPIDLYGFDELCTMLIRDFMPASKILAVRLIGTKAGTAGLQFNKIIVLRAPRFNSDGGASPPAAESTATLLKTIQDSNAQMMSLVQAMRPAPQPDTSLEKILAMSQALNAPMMSMMQALLPALVGRQSGGGLDVGGLSGLLDVATKIADLKGGGNESEISGNDWVDTIRALVPIAKPALETAAEVLKRQPVSGPVGGVPALTGPAQGTPRPPMPAGAVPPRPVPAPQPAPGSVPTQPPPPAVGVTPAPQMSDIPSGDQEMFAQMKPQIDSLVQMADQGSDAIGAADLLFDNVIMELPDEFYSRLGDLIGGPNFIKNAAIFNPGVTKHELWFRQFQAQVVKRYDEEEKAADGTQPTVATQQ